MAELLAEVFSSRVRAAVLAMLLPRPHLAFSLTELSRRLGLPVSSLQHECYKLTRLGLLQDERVGNARRYRPNPAWPLLEPLTSLVVRALPVDEALAGAIEGISGIEESWAAVSRFPGPDSVYLVVVGRLDIEALDGVFDRSRVALAAVAASGRIELAYYRPADWATRLASGEPFAASLVAGRQVVSRAVGYDAGRDGPDVA